MRSRSRLRRSSSADQRVELLDDVAPEPARRAARRSGRGGRRAAPGRARRAAPRRSGPGRRIGGPSGRRRRAAGSAGSAPRSARRRPPPAARRCGSSSCSLLRGRTSHRKPTARKRRLGHATKVPCRRVGAARPVARAVGRAAAHRPGCAPGGTVQTGRVPVPEERRIRLAPDARSPGLARRMLVAALDEAGLTEAGRDAAADTVVLLASELCENAVLHAGTEFEVALRIDDAEVVVTVSDRGAGPLEQHLAQPRRRYGRAAAHGRGLRAAVEARDGVGHAPRAGRHPPDLVLGGDRTGDRSGDRRRPALRDPAHRPRGGRCPAAARRTALRTPVRSIPASRPSGCGGCCTCRPSSPGASTPPSWSPSWSAGCGRCSTPRPWSWRSTRATAPGPRIVARSGPLPEVGPSASAGTVVALPTTAPLRGSLVVRHRPGAALPPDAADLAELVAHRVAMAVESAWLRDVDQRRRAWLAYLADTSELLGQSLDVELTVAVVPQVVVPRLGAWCAVHLIDDAGRLRLAGAHPRRRGAAARAAGGAGTGTGAGRSPSCAPAWPTCSPDGPAPSGSPCRPTASPSRSPRTAPPPAPCPSGGPSTARTAPRTSRWSPTSRAAPALAVHNAQVTAAHVRVSQALQRALLPRALPGGRGPGPGRAVPAGQHGQRRRRRLLRRLPDRPGAVAGRDRRRVRHRGRRRGAHRARCATCCGCWSARAARWCGPSSCSTR